MNVRRPVWALHVLVVGLALHNLVMSQLYRAGLRGAALSAIASWKDVLLVAAVAVVWARRRPLIERLPDMEVRSLVMVGDEDVACPLPQAETLVRHLRNARLVRLPQTGHSVSIERPDEVASPVGSFVAEPS